MSFKRTTWIFLAVISLTILWSTSAFSARTPAPLVLQLQWDHQFQFAGYYVAQQLGFYKDSGLDVEIRPYQPGLDVVDEVLSGRSHFGIGPTSLILNILNHDDIALLGANFQQSPVALITVDPQLQKPRNLIGHKLMVTPDMAYASALQAMLISQGVDLSEITIQPHSSNMDDLVQGKTDAMAVYISNEPYQLEKKNIPYNVIRPEDYGFNSYGDLLYTSRHHLQKFPELSRAFYQASIRGWEWAFEHIEETAQLILCLL